MKRRWVILIFLLGVSILMAQYTRFGKNKIQYRQYQWAVFRTPHFDIYVPEGYELLAKFAADAAEKALPRIEYVMMYSLIDRIPIVIYPSQNEFQETNIIAPILPEGVGGFTEMLKNRIVVPYDGDWAQFRHVVVHELVHGVINQMFYGGSLQRVLLRTNLPELPLWMNEGLAEYLSLEGLDIRTDMFLRDMVMNEVLPPLQYLDGYLAYRGGQAFYWFIEQRYGKHKIGALLQRLVLVKRLQDAIELTFDKSFEDIAKEWAKFLKKRYWPDIQRFQDVEQESQRLTDHQKLGNFYNSSPAISPDGTKVVFISDRSGVFAIDLMDLTADPPTVREIISGQEGPDFEELNILTPGISWSPDGQKVAITAKYREQDVLYIYDLRTDSYERHAWGFQKLHAAEWSPDGTKIAFAATRHLQSDIFVWDLRRDTLYQITDDLFTDGQPTWRDTAGIFFISDRPAAQAPDSPWQWETSQWDIFYVDLSTRQLRQMTFTPEVREYDVQFVEQEESLYFTSDYSGIANIYRYDLAADSVVAVTAYYSPVYQFSLTPDGEKLVMAVQNAGGYDLFLLRFPHLQSLALQQVPMVALPNRTSQQTAVHPATTVAHRAILPLAGGKVRLRFDRQRLVKPKENALVRMQDLDSLQQWDPDTLQAERYKVRFSPDVILGTAGYDVYFGVLGQLLMLFSDMLGDHQIFVAANLLYDVNNSDLWVQYALLPYRNDYYFQGFHTVRFGIRNNYLYRFRYLGLGAAVSIPLDRFNRLEIEGTGLGTFTENIDLPTEVQQSYHFLLQSRFVHDNVFWASTLEPYRGVRFAIGGEAIPSLLSSSLDFWTLRADVRGYLPLWKADYVLAGRTAAAGSWGQTPQRFYLLGIDQWLNPVFSGNTFPFRNAEDLFFYAPIYPTRGAQVNEQNGRYFVLTNLEFRFPLIRLFIPGALPIAFQNVRGAIFADLAGVWDAQFQFFENRGGERVPKNFFASVGVSSRFVLFGLPARIDVAWKYMGEKFSAPIWLFSLGFAY